VGFDRRQPSQDFGPIIGDRKVMTVIHVEDIGAVGKRDGITIPAAGSIENIAITILRVGSVDRNIMSSKIGIMEDLVTEVGYGGLFLALDDPSPESERKVGFITAQLVKIGPHLLNFVKPILRLLLPVIRVFYENISLCLVEFPNTRASARLIPHFCYQEGRSLRFRVVHWTNRRYQVSRRA